MLILIDQIRLIVIDSFSYLLRDVTAIPNNRVQLTYEMLSELQEVAVEFNCAVSAEHFSFILPVRVWMSCIPGCDYE